MQQKIKDVLLGLGLNPEPKTILRYEKVLRDISAQHEDLIAIKQGIFVEEATGNVIEKGIPIFSYCAHHLLPWFGRVHIGYIADGKVLGLSKFTRIVRYYAVGLTLQENVGKGIANFLEENVSPDVIVYLEAMHTCKVSRGVTNPFSRTVTIEARGKYRGENTGPRLEFFTALQLNDH